jgi:transcriptional regulator with XRE-family HTH domain
MTASRSKSSTERGFDEEVGRRITLLRRQQRLTQRKLAKSVGISTARLYGYEVGDVRCPPIYLRKISDVLRVPVGYLIPEVQEIQDYLKLPAKC